ncbi:MAG: hypothetical protein ABMA64_08680 [Myxococcota bacterium]
MWFPITVALTLGGCAGTDDETTQYLSQLQPLLQENGLLAERVLLQSAKIYNEAVKPDQVAEAWITDIVPVAEHLHNQSSFVTPPSSYAQSHADLVLIWGDRALGYRNLGEAIQTGNTDEWNKARDLIRDVTLREEKWFDTLNTALAPSKIMVDPYP